MDVRKGLVALASLVVSLGVAEWLLRAWSPDRFYVWKPGTTTISEPVPGVMPGVEGTSRFEINEHGLRADSFSDDQRYRILALGGSTTECFYLDTEEAWPHLLQEELSAGWGVPVWVGNAGRSGHSSRRHIAQAGILLDQYPGIDALVVLVGVNDFHQFLAYDENWSKLPPVERMKPERYARHLSAAFAVLPARYARHGRFHERLELTSLLHRARLRLFPEVAAHANVMEKGGQNYVRWRRNRQLAAGIRTELPWLYPILEEYRRNVATIGRAARDAGVRPVFLTQPPMWRADLPEHLRELLLFGGVGDYFGTTGNEYYSVEALAEGMRRFNHALKWVCSEQGFEVVDLAKRLPKDDSVLFDDCHFNESGARRVAEEVARHFLAGPAPGELVASPER